MWLNKVPESEKFLEDKIFLPFKMNRWETIKPDGKKGMVSFEGQSVPYDGPFSPILDHYNIERNKKLGKLLFEP